VGCLCGAQDTRHKRHGEVGRYNNCLIANNSSILDGFSESMVEA